MRLIRVHVDVALAPGARAQVRGAAAGHLARVLRLQAGDPVTAFNGDGSDYPARILALAKDTVDLEVLDRVAARPESPLALALVQGVARTDRMDLVVQKATELGVASIQPVLTARCVVRLDGSAAERKLAHWRGVAIAACEQCGRARLPAIAMPLPLADWLRRQQDNAVTRIQLSPDAVQPLAAAAAGARSVELLVGPEGGLEEDEAGAARSAGYQPCLLGPRVLRSETAALAAIAVLQATAGDLR